MMGLDQLQMMLRRTTARWASLLLLVGAGACSVTPVVPPPGTPRDAQSRPDAEPADTSARADERIGRTELTDADRARSELLFSQLAGDVAAHRGAYARAAEYYTRAAQGSGDAELAQQAAQAALLASELDQAEQAARLWQELAPETPGPYQMLAAVLLQKGDRAGARAALHRLLSLGSFESSGDYLNLARLFSREGSQQNMLVMMDEILGTRPDDAAALFAYALLAVRLGEPEQALARSERLVALRGDDLRSALLHVQILQLLDRGDAAADFLENFAARNPDDLEARIALGRLLIDQQEFERALRQFDQVLARQPGDEDTLLALAMINMQLERTPQARRHLRALARTDEHRDRAHFYLGRLADQADDRDQAIRWYRRVAGGEHRLDAVLRHAELLAETGRLDESLSVLHGAAVEDSGEQIRLLLTEVDILLDDGQAERAERLVNEALTEHGEHLDLLFARSLVLEKLDRLEDMERDLKRILELDPNNPHALNAWGYTLADRNLRLQEALDLITRANELAPGNPFILDSLGWIHYRLGNLEQALDYLEQALELMPDPEVYAHLGEVLLAMGREAEARRMVQRGLEQKPGDARLLRVLGKLNGT